MPTFLICWILILPGVASPANYRIVDSLEIDTVPSWFPVGFCLLTRDEQQYVAYYNAEHQLIVARRGVKDDHWERQELPTKVGWDSHNYITMAFDSAGGVHLAGNMHCVPLIYFRTAIPGDITTFERLPMTGRDEQRCTYPRFLNDADGNLLFTYRSGSSGNGRRFYNIYDIGTKTWSRFLDDPLFDGQGERNAYPLGPVRGPDELYHIVWVWRDTPDCATNHHLSYARSRDLKRWEGAGGTPATLPLTLQQEQLWVDPIPPGGGIINGCEKLAFDSQGRPMVSYHKSDENGQMQIYISRFEDGGWKQRAITDWDQPIAFSGRGAMPFIGISVSGLKPLRPGLYTLTYRHRVFGSGRLVVDETDLQPVAGEFAMPPEFPAELSRPTISFPGIRVKLAGDTGEAEDADRCYVLRWETLSANHDRPRQPPLPPASVLTLVTLERD
jgi:hypothetical protein